MYRSGYAIATAYHTQGADTSTRQAVPELLVLARAEGMLKNSTESTHI